MVIQLEHSGERTLGWLKEAGLVMDRIFAEDYFHEHSVDFLYEKCAKVLGVSSKDIVDVQVKWEEHFGLAYREYLEG